MQLYNTCLLKVVMIENKLIKKPKTKQEASS